MTTTTDRPAQPQQFRVIGTRPIRHDGLEKVTGRAKYGIDTSMAGLLHGAILRSPHPHARIKRIDASNAERITGVKAVVTAHDFPEKPAQSDNFWEVLADVNYLAMNVMAKDKVVYQGQAVAAVAAVSRHVAEEALDLINVEYEPLPYVTDIVEAMKPEAPIIHENPAPRQSATGPMATQQGKPSNIVGRIQFATGDIAKAFAEAHVVVERAFHTRAVHQGYIEPINSTAWWAPNGKLTIWNSSQAPFIQRQQIALLLNIPVSSIRIVPMEIGGGFGGKVNTHIDPITATLSKKAGAPVKIVLGRKEVFEGTGCASSTVTTVKMGAAKDGRIVAAEATFVYNAGAFPGGASGSGMFALAPYKITNVKIDACNVITNTPWAEAYRAPGVPQAAHAVEQVVDEIAQKLNIDPMELRLKNVTRPGDRGVTGMPFPSMGIAELEQAMRDHPHYKAPLGGKNRGRGVSIGFWGNHGMQSSATIAVNSDGTINMVTGSVDIGGQRASLAMQAAEVLGIAAEDVSPNVGDTDSVGYTAVTGGSRTTHDTGIAVITASRQVLGLMRERAALLWETTADEVAFEQGEFYPKRDPKQRLGFKQLARQLMKTGGPISASTSVEPKSIGPSIAGLMVDVEVDHETGKVDVLRATVFQDVGKAAHPSYVEGQMQGGAVQGIGWALNEEYWFNAGGAMTNGSFLDYRLPTSLDLPRIEPVLVEVPSPGHPFGIRGVGECSIVPPLAAVSNAVSRATGVRMTDLPMSPGYIVKRLRIGKT